MLKAAPAKFEAALAKIPELGPKSNWLHLETSAPCCLPADQVGGRYDLIKHARGTVMFESAGKNGWLQTGELYQVGLAWRLTEGPVPGAAPADNAGGPDVNANPELMKLVDELAALDKQTPPVNGVTDPRVVQHHLKRADIIERIIAVVKPEEREAWIRQVADSLSGAARPARPTTTPP